MNNATNYNGKLNIVGFKIKEYRKKLGFSQSELSAKQQLVGIDIPKNSLQRLESGKRIIKDYELAALSKILKVSIDSLVGDFVDDL